MKTFAWVVIGLLAALALLGLEHRQSPSGQLKITPAAIVEEISPRAVDQILPLCVDACATFAQTADRAIECAKDCARKPVVDIEHYRNADPCLHKAGTVGRVFTMHAPKKKPAHVVMQAKQKIKKAHHHKSHVSHHHKSHVSKVSVTGATLHLTGPPGCK
jgi:hypothetical protein